MTTSESIKVYGKIRQNFPSMKGFFCSPSDNRFNICCDNQVTEYKQQIDAFKKAQVVNGLTIIFNHFNGCCATTIERVEL